ncbi:MAG: threonine ammonia-lyase IlvA [Stappiaceae bacterium]
MTEYIDAVKTAKQAMSAILTPTPLQNNVYLSQMLGADIYLKREDLTPVRSYKLRGAYNFFRKALEADLNKAHTFVCASAGNHAQGFAYTCRYFGKNGTVFMPVTTPQQKIDKTCAFGGSFIDIELVGDYFDQCYRAAQAFSEQQQATMVPPFDHRDIIEGQATVGLELIEQIGADRKIDILILPVGGGGLSSGVTQVFQQCSPETQIILTEPSGAPSLKRSLQADQRVQLEQVDNFVDGAAVAEIGELNFEILRTFDEEDVVLVPENRLCATIVEMLNIEGIVLEPAGALTVDVAKACGREILAGKTVVCVTSGGNFDFERLPEVKEKALRFSGLKKYFILRMPQRPGALRDFLEMLGPHDDIARFEYLKKSARNFGTVLIGVETNDPANFEALANKLTESELKFQDITDNDILGGLII